MAWDFGNAVNSGGNEIFAAVKEKHKLAQEAIKNHLQTAMDGTKAVLDVADKIEDPAMKAALYTKGAVPMIKMLTGYDPGVITPEMLQNQTTKAAVDGTHQLLSDYLHQVPDANTKKPMTLNEFKLKVGLLFSASKQAAEQFGPMNEMMNSVAGSVKQNVPGPGNTDTTGTVDPVQGTVTPLMNTATNQPTTTGPKPKEIDPNSQRASIESSIARDEKTLQALVNPSKGKDGLPNVQGSWLTNLKRGGKAPGWTDFSAKEQAQIALAQSTTMRLKANLDSVNKLREAQGLEPVEMQPAAVALADQLSKIKDMPGTSTTSTAGAKDPNADAVAYLAKNHPALKNPTPADIAWAQGKVKK